MCSVSADESEVEVFILSLRDSLLQELFVSATSARDRHGLGDYKAEVQPLRQRRVRRSLGSLSEYLEEGSMQESLVF